MRLGLVAALVLLGGCAVKKSYKAGMTAEERSEEWSAAHHYLDALDRRDTHRKSTEGLARVALEGWREGYADAQEQESTEHFAEALRGYEALQRYTERLEAHGALSFPVDVDVEAKIEEMRSAAAYQHYNRAEGLLQRRSYPQAIEQFEAALRIVPDYKDTHVRMAETRYAWASEDLADRHYRDAAGRYATAVTPDGTAYEDALDRSAHLYGALGRHHVGAGTCRQAVRDLNLAAARFPTEYQALRDQAVECATVGVEVLRFPGRIRVDGLDPGAAISDAVRRGLPDRTSDFVVVVDGTPTRGQKTVEADFVINGTVSEARIDDVARNESARTVVGKRFRECASTEFSPCSDAITLSYRRVDSTLRGRVSTQLQVTRVTNRQIVVDRALTADTNHTVAWAEDFRDPAGGLVGFGTQIGTVELPEDVAALRDADRNHPAPADAVRAMLDDIARQALDAVVPVVDADPPAQDPATLELGSAFAPK